MQKNEKCVLLFHNIRNLDVKLQLGHPLPLKTLDLISMNSYWVGKIHQHQISSYFFSLTNVGTSIVTSDLPYAGDRYDTSQPVEHSNNTFTVFLFYM
jgi:hypothetical protein